MNCCKQCIYVKLPFQNCSTKKIVPFCHPEYFIAMLWTISWKHINVFSVSVTILYLLLELWQINLSKLNLNEQVICLNWTLAKVSIWVISFYECKLKTYFSEGFGLDRLHLNLKNNWHCYKMCLYLSFSEENMLWRARNYADARQYEKASKIETPSCDRLQEIYAWYGVYS